MLAQNFAYLIAHAEICDWHFYRHAVDDTANTDNYNVNTGSSINGIIIL